MIDLEDAQQTVLAACPPLAPVVTGLADVVGRVLAEDVVSGEDVPPFANTAVDGYAVRAADLAAAPVELDVVGEVAAGAPPFAGVVGPGQAVRVMTGAPMPAGTDAAAMVEDSERLDGDRVRLHRSGRGRRRRPGRRRRRPGRRRRRPGGHGRDARRRRRAGQHQRPRACSPTGRCGSPCSRRATSSSATGRRCARARSARATRRCWRRCWRPPAASSTTSASCATTSPTLERVLREAAASNDAIVTSGGVSMGDYDVVKAVLGRIAEMTWMQIAIKPAKPFAFGLLDGVPVFGLPGNPVSSLVSFELLARPALRRMMGHHRLARTSLVAVADAGLARRPDGKVHLVRVNGDFADDGRYHVRPVGGPGQPPARRHRPGRRARRRPRRRRRPRGRRRRRAPARPLTRILGSMARSISSIPSGG